jgi:hypothetical protein
VQIQGNLVEMLTPALAPTATNDEITALMTDLVDRLLSHFSGGLLTELHAELADALPRLSRDGTGLVDTNLDAFEAQTAALVQRSARWDAEAPKLVETLRAADTGRADSATVPLYGKAARELVPALEIQIGGKRVRLAERSRWTVSGTPVAAPKPQPAARPEPAAERRPEPVRAPVAVAPVVASPAPRAAASVAATAPSPAPAPVAAVASPAPALVAAAPAAAAARPEPAPSPVSKPTPIVPITPTAIAMIGPPSEGDVAAANRAPADVEAVLPSSSAIEVNLHGDRPPPSEAPASATPPTATAEPSVQATAATVPAEPEEEAEPRRKAKDLAPLPAGEASLPQAALAPGKRSPAASLGFFLALFLFAIAYLAWRWMHHHASLPMR